MDGSDLLELREVAERAADTGARIVGQRFGSHRGTGEAKGKGDWVSSVDRESEAAVTAWLERSTPGIRILAEEGGGERGDLYWVVDPLDGTTNFLIGFPAVCVAVALIERGRPVVAAIRAPMLGLSFSGARGHGARSGSTPIQVSDRAPERALVATALPFRDRSLLDRYLPVLERVFGATEDVRRVGSAELDLAWVACGVWDGYFELNLGVWDVAAGALLVEESGGIVTDWGGGPDYLAGDVLAGSPATHRVLLEASRGASG